MFPNHRWLFVLFVLSNSAFADVNGNNSIFYGWDEPAMGFENGNVKILGDGSWTQVFAGLAFNDALVDPLTAGGPACTNVNNTSTKWAGTLKLGMMNVDTGLGPGDTNGFTETQNWELISCDRDGDGDSDGGDLDHSPPYDRDIIATTDDPTNGLEINPGYIALVTKDEQVACASNGCEYHIITTLFVTLDADCDGSIDPIIDTPTPGKDVCFYAEAKKPSAEWLPAWKGPIQAAIEGGTGSSTGQKTVNYSSEEAPTIATIGNVEVIELSISQYLAETGFDKLSDTKLAELVADWSQVSADSLSGASKEELSRALTMYLDPDGNGQVGVVKWETLQEIGTIGFYVERQKVGQENDHWERVSNNMLPGMITAPLGAEYMLADPLVQPGIDYRYQLIEQEARGALNTYGPYLLRID